MATLVKNRIESIDLLKGLVMVIMALDHVREYFHASNSLFDPADPERSYLFLFFTRWITHFCAPTFSFLAGLSAYMAGKKKTKNELSVFLLSRGLWLVFLEVTIVNFAWYFDFSYRTVSLLVIWSLGMSMILLAGLIYLPKNGLLIFCCTLILGHNLLDNVHVQNLFWSLLHDQKMLQLTEHTSMFIGYPLIPWVAVMALGYYFGRFYENGFTAEKRKKYFNWIGIISIVLFLLLRFTNLYGDSKPFKNYGILSSDLISFFNPSKYPPSLLYILMTLGVAFLFLANSEQLKGKIVAFFTTFGRVPFFYYILHLYLIHLIAMLFAQLSGIGWQKLILSTWINFDPNVKGYGFNLLVVYLVWFGLIAMLYPICKWYDRYKQDHKEKWWLSYL